MDKMQTLSAGSIPTSTRFFLFCLWLALCCWPTIAQADPAADISAYRQKHGESKVVADSTLTRLAREQAAAMAAKDRLDHDVIGRFSSRIDAAGAGRAAENIAYGHDSFARTLNQWIESGGHRRNLLLSSASRVGVASARSPTGRTYWAMVIAGGYDKRAPARAARAEGKAKSATAAKASAKQACRLKILGLCL